MLDHSVTQQLFSPRKKNQTASCLPPSIHFGGDVSEEGYAMFAVEI